MAIIIFTIKQNIISMVSDRMQRDILCPDGSAGHTAGTGISPEDLIAGPAWNELVLVFLSLRLQNTKILVENIKYFLNLLELVISQAFFL